MSDSRKTSESLSSRIMLRIVRRFLPVAEIRKRGKVSKMVATCIVVCTSYFEIKK